MDGIHDLGGMQGFGPIPIEKKEPVFHADWEAHVMAMRLLMGFWRKWNLDASRNSIESLPPADYLGFSYYEKWLASLVNLMVDAGMVTIEEIAASQAAPGAQKSTPPINAAGLTEFLKRGRPTVRQVNAEPMFVVGDRVRTVQYMHSDHHRLPGYIRDRVGEITLRHGAHVFPDTHAKLGREDPQHLYAVRFLARQLWGDEGNVQDTVTADLWESYLVPE